MRFSSLVSICSYSSLIDESDEIVDVGVVEEPIDDSDDAGDDASVAVAGAVDGTTCSTPVEAGVGDELAEAIFSTDFSRSRYRLMS